MKYAVCVAASVFVLTACNKGPKVELHNATGNQVAEAVKRSGVMTSDASMIQPGLWQSKVTVLEMLPSRIVLGSEENQFLHASLEKVPRLGSE